MKKQFNIEFVLFWSLFLYSCLVLFFAACELPVPFQKKELLKLLEQMALFIVAVILIISLYRLFKTDAEIMAKAENIVYKKYLYLLLFPALVYCILFSLSAYHSRFLENFDFTNISSSINHTAKGLGFLRTAYFETGKSGAYLGHHFSPFLVFFVPVYFIANLIPTSILTDFPILIYFKTHFLYALCLGAIYFCGIAAWLHYSQKKIGVRLSIVALIYFLFLPVLMHLNASYHYELPVVPVSAYFFYQIEKKKATVHLLIALVLFVSIKEDISIYLALFGLYLMSYKESLRKGFFVFLFSILYFVMVKFIWIPWFANYQPIAWESYWTTSFGPDIQSRIMPSIMILLSSGMLLILHFRLFVIVIIPILFIHAMSNHLFHQAFIGHYGYSIIPFLLYAIVNGLHRINNIQNTIGLKVATPLIALGLVFFFYSNTRDKLTPFPLFDHKSRSGALMNLNQIIPVNSCVFSQSNLSPHLPLHSTALPLFHKTNNYYSRSIEELILNPHLPQYRYCSHILVLLSEKYSHARENNSAEYQELLKDLAMHKIVPEQKNGLLLYFIK